MKRSYVEPDLELVRFTPGDVCDVIHTSNEQGGANTEWTFNNNDDEDWGVYFP